MSTFIRPEQFERGGGMIHAIWLLLLLGGVVVAGANGQIEKVTEAAAAAAHLGVETVLGLLGIMVLWLGMARIAEEAGLIHAIAKGMAPFLRWLFPSVPRDHPAMGAILMNLSANLLGLGSAATPFGLRAMQELQKLNPNPTQASNAMCTFLAVNTSSVTLIPATIIALRAGAGSRNPAEIVSSALLATLCSTCVAVAVDYLFRRRSPEA